MKEQGLKAKMLEMEAHIKRLEMLIKHFGFCHPDMQVARLDKHEAFEKFREYWSTECDPRMPLFRPREEPGDRELKPPGTV